jgi:hypothetical protein
MEVILAAIRADHAGALDRACSRDMWFLLINLIKRTAFNNIVTGFFEAIGSLMCVVPAFSSSPVKRPPWEATIDVHPVDTIALATSRVVLSAPPVSSLGII